MRTSRTLRLAAAAALGASALTFAGPVGAASARVADAGEVCLDTHAGEGGAAARGGHAGLDHRDISAREQRAIERRTAKKLKGNGVRPSAGATIPVYVHVMRDEAGNGDVTNQQIADQITVMNQGFSGTGYTFTLADTKRYDNSTWHRDRASAKYRSETRLGGADALNMWLVDFKYLGIATFPWDYQRNGDIDGIRVHYASLPGGAIQNYNEGDTATHEAGHWFGLYHTFQGGCTEINDEVGDTPAQAGPTGGCPADTTDTCPLPGVDPIHNYMDYSYDVCMTEFTAGQGERAQQMFAAYRG
ncbi:MAG: zinc metalloprotease [Nocardioides sp.]